MRFDDSLETVLAADMSNPFGAQSGWRQLVDLIGRGRAPADAAAIDRLRTIRPMVPAAIRGASARALAFARPPAALVALFAEDDLPIAAPVLRIAHLSAEEWIAMLPCMAPAGRSVLRHRRDLSPEVGRALESFGATDFVLATTADPVEDVPIAVPAPLVASEAADPALAIDWTDVIDPVETPAPPVSDATPLAIDWTDVIDPGVVVAPRQTPPLTEAPPAVADLPAIDWTEVIGVPVEVEARAAPPIAAEEAPVAQAVDATIDWTDVVAARSPADLPAAPSAPSPVAEGIEAPIDAVEEAAPPAEAPPSMPADSSFVSLASVAFGLPVVAEAMKLHDRAPPVEAPVALTPPATADAEAGEATGPFQIADLVARIEAFQRQREDEAPDRPDIQPEDVARIDAALTAEPVLAASEFRYETDSSGTICWVSGVARAPVIGISLAPAAAADAAHVDGSVAGAVRRRSAFTDGRLQIAGTSDAAGAWQVSGVPAFDRTTGRFTGYRGWARRPRADERAEPIARGRSAATDSLRQLVHELRTPTTAIAGFAEMIESELLGPVATPYRQYASTIRESAAALLGAIDDLDTAARIEAHALDLRPTRVALLPIFTRISADLAPLCALRGATIAVEAHAETDVCGDDRAVDRLLSRLMAALASAAGSGEVIGVRLATIDDVVVVDIIRPRALAAYPEETLLAIDAEREAEQGAEQGAPLLGTGFALRLARNLAVELGGSLAIGAEHLTLRLPAALSLGVDQASTN